MKSSFRKKILSLDRIELAKWGDQCMSLGFSRRDIAKILKRDIYSRFRYKEKPKQLCLVCNQIQARLGDEICSHCVNLYFKRTNGSNLQGMDRTRQIVRLRDKNTCQSCGKVWVQGTRRFDVHHLDGLCGKLSRSYDKASSIGRLITLCHRCHLNLPEVKEKMLLKSSPRPNKPRFPIPNEW